MASFKHQSLDVDGNKVRGLVEAPDEGTARQRLQQQALTPVTVKLIKKPLTVEELIARVRPVPSDSLATFTRNLAMMVGSGTGSLKSLFTLEGQEPNIKLKAALREIGETHEAGEPLSSAFATHPKTFDNLYISMLRSGEVGGTMALSLERLATQLEFNGSLRRKVRSAMVYPAFVLSFMFWAVLGLIVFLVPKFQEFYDTFDADLPWITVKLTQLTDQIIPADGKLIPLQALAIVAPFILGGFLATLLQKAKLGYVSGIVAAAIAVGGEVVVWLTRDQVGGSFLPVPGGSFVAMLFRLGMMMGIFVLIGMAFRFWINTPSGRDLWDRFKLRAPFGIGKLVRKICVARYAATMSTLIQSGTPIIEAYEITAQAVGNTVVRDVLLEVANQLESGESIIPPLRASPVFEPMVVSMLEVGEENAKLGEMLDIISKRYNSDIETQIGTLQKMLEPLMFILLGIAVGAVMIAMMAPIWSIWGELSSQV